MRGREKGKDCETDGERAAVRDVRKDPSVSPAVVKLSYLVGNTSNDLSHPSRSKDSAEAAFL